MKQLNYYELLGLEANATYEEISKKYRQKAKECHPDLHPNDKHANEKMTRLTAIYETLSNPVSRKKYDLTIGIVFNDNDYENSNFKYEYDFEEYIINYLNEFRRKFKLRFNSKCADQFTECLVGLNDVSYERFCGEFEEEIYEEKFLKLRQRFASSSLELDGDFATLEGYTKTKKLTLE